MAQRIHAQRVVLGEAQDIQRHHRIHHRRIDRAQAVGVVQPLHHPVPGLLHGGAADGLAAAPLPPLEQLVHAEEEIVPGEEGWVVMKSGAHAGQPEFIQVEPGGHGPPRIGRVHDGKRDHDGARPCRHLVQQVEGQQRDFRWNARRIFPRIEIEEAEVDLDVAVGRLYAAERQNALAQQLHALAIHGHARQFQREISFDRGADFGRSAGIDIEAAIGQLPLQNRDHRLIDQRARLGRPFAVDRRVEPELKKNVIGFESGVGGKLRAPVAVAFLEASQVIRRLAHGLLGRELQRVADL